MHVSPAGGVLLSGGVFGSDGGRGDAHQAGPRQGRAGEVSAIQRSLQRSQERKGTKPPVNLWFSLKLIICHIDFETLVHFPHLNFCPPLSSFAFLAGLKGSPSSPGPTPASSAKGNLNRC